MFLKLFPFFDLIVKLLELIFNPLDVVLLTRHLLPLGDQLADSPAMVPSLLLRACRLESPPDP